MTRISDEYRMKAKDILSPLNNKVIYQNVEYIYSSARLVTKIEINDLHEFYNDQNVGIDT